MQGGHKAFLALRARFLLLHPSRLAGPGHLLPEDLGVGADQPVERVPHEVEPGKGTGGGKNLPKWEWSGANFFSPPFKDFSSEIIVEQLCQTHH